MKKFLKTRFLPLLGVLVLLISAVIVPVSAAEYAVDNTIVAYDPILDNYPTSNMLPFPYRFRGTTTTNGLTITSNADTSITFDGIPTQTLYNVVSRIYLPAGDYVLTGVPLGTTNEIWTTVRTPQGNFYKGSSGDRITFTVQSDTDLIEILISVNSGYVVDVQTFYPMLSKGTTPYPWSLYLPYQFSQKYDEGHQLGESTGYENGYQKGQEDLANAATDGLENVFQVKPSLTVEAYQGILLDTYSNVPYTLIDGKISFSSIYDYLLSNALKPLSRYWSVNLCFEWEINTSVPEDLRLYPTISSSVLSVSSEIMPTGLRIIDSVSSPQVQYDYATAVLSDGVYHFDTSANEGAKFNQLSLTFAFPSDQDISILQSASIWSSSVVPSEVFQNGYVKGFYDGENQSFQEVKEEAYQEGEKVGFRDGYLTGKKEGLELAEQGDWRQLMIAVAEAPINTFTSLFNFEILGMNMRLAFGSILAVCVLLIVIKKVIL